MSLRFGIAALAMSFVAFTQRPKDATAAPQGVGNRREGVVGVSFPLVCWISIFKLIYVEFQADFFKDAYC